MIDVCCSKEAGKLAKFRVWDKVLKGSALFLEIYNIQRVAYSFRMNNWHR